MYEIRVKTKKGRTVLIYRCSTAEQAYNYINEWNKFPTTKGRYLETKYIG